MVSTTPDLHSNPWGFIVLTRPLRLTLHLGVSLSNASMAFDAFDPRTKTTKPLMACQAQRTAKSKPKPTATNRTPRVQHVFFYVCPACSPRVSTCLPRVYHVSTTCSLTCAPRVHHVFTTCSPRVHHVFTTCSPRVHHVFTTCSPRVHHVFSTYSPRVHHVFTHVLTTCSPCVYHVYTTCSPSNREG